MNASKYFKGILKIERWTPSILSLNSMSIIQSVGRITQIFNSYKPLCRLSRGFQTNQLDILKTRRTSRNRRDIPRRVAIRYGGSPAEILQPIRPRLVLGPSWHV